MVIDCGSCLAPGREDGSACADCVVSVLLGPMGLPEIPPEHEQAVGALVESGLVPPLRLVPGERPVRQPRRAAG